MQVIAARLAGEFPDLPVTVVERIVRECYEAATGLEVPDLRTQAEELARARLVVNRPAAPPAERTPPVERHPGRKGPSPFMLRGSTATAVGLAVVVRSGQEWDIRRDQTAWVESGGTVTAFAGSTVYAEAGSTVYAYSDTTVHLPASGSVRLMAHATATIIRDGRPPGTGGHPGQAAFPATDPDGLAT